MISLFLSLSISCATDSVSLSLFSPCLSFALSLFLSVSAELALALDVISTQLVTGNMEAISGSVCRVPCERLGGGSVFFCSLHQHSACCLLLCYIHSLLKPSPQRYCLEPILFIFLFYFEMVSFIFYSSSFYCFVLYWLPWRLL